VLYWMKSNGFGRNALAWTALIYYSTIYLETEKQN